MPRIERTGPLPVLAAAAVGIAAGLIVQFWLSSRGASPFIPPLSLPVSQTLLGLVLLVFGLRLRRAMHRGTGAVNPFHAVRLLAAARAGQLVGGLLGGFGGGLALSLLGRSVPAPPATWAPMLLALAGGAILVALAAVTERLCRVPPGDGEDESETEPDAPGGAPADQPAFRRP